MVTYPQLFIFAVFSFGKCIINPILFSRLQEVDMKRDMELMRKILFITRTLIDS